MNEENQVVNKDLIPEVGLFGRDVLKEAHDMIKTGVNVTDKKFKSSIRDTIESVLLKTGEYDGIIWIAPPFLGITHTRKKNEFKVALQVLGNEVCSTIIGDTRLGETLTADAFIAKAKIYVGYDATKQNLIYKGTACYRKIPSLSWRCITTGERLLYSLN